MALDKAILDRHASRWFTPTPVPAVALREALALASHAPSNSNIQPWRLFVVTGSALDRLKDELVTASSAGVAPAIPPLPPAFQHFRSELGQQVYGEGWGVARGDAEGRRAAVLRNFEFFGAPVGVLACIDRSLTKADVVSLGMYLQTFLLALTERGIGSCVEVSVAGYPEVISRSLEPWVHIPAELEIVAGIAVGYEDKSLHINHIRAGRVSIEDTVTFVQ
ncbi:Nitroreductase-like protein [Rhypophila decipiens]|uniref:Nitroreductase-like protein n=1 Tax=Rhypophila decipiens TaxID=261697 RepID=A0AAN7B639_9PEZI|nr:Nitroreductase-like protein [Rhypophila decipiens]